MILSLIDIKKKWVPPIGQVFLIINFLIYKNFQLYILFGITFSIILILAYIFYFKKIGGGDIKVLMILSFFYNENIFLIILIACLSAMLFLIITKIKIIPFIPFITLGVIYVEFTKYI